MHSTRKGLGPNVVVVFYFRELVNTFKKFICGLPMKILQQEISQETLEVFTARLIDGKIAVEEHSILQKHQEKEADTFASQNAGKLVQWRLKGPTLPSQKLEGL